jgi:glycosyltransferase involved in cell wall biosynthesis
MNCVTPSWRSQVYPREISSTGLSLSKVLHVVEPGCDGVFRHVEQLVRNHLSYGLDVGLACSSIRGSDRLFRLVQDVRLSGGVVCDLRVGRAPCLRDPVALLHILYLIRRFVPQVIHCHSSKAGIIGRAAGRICCVPTIYTPHAYYGMGRRSGAHAALFNGIERLFAGLGHTINVSEDEAVFARKSLGVMAARQSVIPNAVDTDVFNPGAVEEKKRWRLAKGLPADAAVIGTVGRLSYQKDPLNLYRAFELVSRHRPDVYLAHLGTGELASECEEWIGQSGLSPRILRIEYSPEPSEFYRALDGFVLSSRYEGLSFAVLEALATDLPLVLTDVPGNRDFLRLGLSHVWSAPAEAPDALAVAMEACLVDLENGRPSNHRAVALERFSEEACFGKVLELYREIANSRRKQHSLASST